MSAGGAGDADTGELGVSPRDPQDAWRVGAGMQPDDAVEGEAAVQEAITAQTPADADAGEPSTA